MKIYGKTLQEIFAELPFSYKIVVIAGSLFIVFTFFYVTVGSFDKLLRGDPDKRPGVLKINANSSPSVFDPSLAVDTGNNVSALAYTSYNSTLPASQPGAMNIGIARSDAPCDKWIHLQNIFTSKSDTILAPDAKTELAQGITIYETPSVVYDPADEGAEWKVFAYRYFVPKDENFNVMQRYSMITMRTAPSVNGPWKEENWVLSAAPDYPPSPYGDSVGTKIANLNPVLSRYTLYSRPSVVMDGKYMLMTLSAFAGSRDVAAVIMLMSPDHGRNWAYLGTPLTMEDVQKAGYTRLSGASLMQNNGQLYLAAVLGDNPVDAKTVKAQGTFIIPFAEKAKGALQRDTNGNVNITQTIPLLSSSPTTTGGGFAAYDASCLQGVITSEFSGLRNAMQIFQSRKKIAP